LFFRPNNQGFAAITDEILEVGGSAVELVDRKTDVDDVDRVFFLEDVIAHFGIPSLGLVSVVDTSLEELRHEFDIRIFS